MSYRYSLKSTVYIHGLSNLTFICAELYYFSSLLKLHKQTNEGARANSLSNTSMGGIILTMIPWKLLDR